MARSRRTRKAGRRAALLLAVLLGVGAGWWAAAGHREGPVRTRPVIEGAVTDHVLVVSLDGLRPDAIHRFRARTLQRLAAEGAWSADARTILPSRTLPGHMSMVSGEPPDVHGVVHNDDPDRTRWVVDVPTIFALAHGRGMATAGFFSKRKFRQLYEPNTLDAVDHPQGWPVFRPAWVTASRVVRHLRRQRPQLLFVHFAEPDYIGHTTGWMSRPYGWAVRWTDRELARILAAADRAFGPGAYTVIVTSDHGGHGYSHGDADPRNVAIPWIAWGRGVVPGTSLPPGIWTMDTAATAMWLLGIDRPGSWTGMPVLAAFHQEPP
jgi:predicted AlkP superfamily pyrophosphatase or phosphodiesterase